MPAESRLHLDADSLNALLADYVTVPGKLEARFEAGVLHLEIGALALSIERLELTPDGLDIHLQAAGKGESA